LNNESKFNFEKVEPAKYLLWIYEDKNNDNKYSKGKLNPYESAEKFNFFPDTLNLRARWPIGDINIIDN